VYQTAGNLNLAVAGFGIVGMPFLWADTQRLEADDGAFFQHRRHMGINPVEVFDLTRSIFRLILG
jgi:hypothetical protein